jgi:hypothetical protein
MPDDLDYEIQQARDEFAKVGTLSTIDADLARRYLDAAIRASERTERREWDSLFGFWRTMIRGGWRCPACGGQMEHGEASGVRCKTWNCVWVPGQRR